MPPPDDGNEYLPFTDMIALETLSSGSHPDTFRSIALPFTPGGIKHARGAAYGGHVFAQAAWAACQTVPEGFTLSNVTGHFIIAGLPNVPYTYTVQRVRDGRSYCTRSVNVMQKREGGVMFTCTCIFKTRETSAFAVQAGVDVREKYRLVLEGKSVEEFEECPGFDVPWYWRRLEQGEENDRFPGLECRKADMRAWNEGKHPLDRRQLIFYRSIGELPKDDLNLHLVAHLYASDRNSLFIVANHLGIGDLYKGIGSLVHHVVFHGNAEEMVLEDAEWFVTEAGTTRYEGGRGLFVSRAWSPKGRHVMSVMQDGLIRLAKDDKAEGVLEGWEGLREDEMEIVKRRAREKEKKKNGKL